MILIILDVFYNCITATRYFCCRGILDIPRSGYSIVEQINEHPSIPRSSYE